MSAALPYVFLGGYAALIPSDRAKNIVRSDAEPQTLATRGSVIPYLIGRRRVGAIFGWAGARAAIPQRSGSGGKGGGSRSKGTTQIVYAERGWQMLALGPVKKLYKIWVGGKVVFDDEINSTDDESGSTHFLNDNSGDEFRIYWGEVDQPVDAQLGADTTIASRWPGVCYVYWRKKTLGTVPRWPLIEYEIESEPVDSPLAEGSKTISVEVEDPVETIEGPNPVHVLTQILYGPWPRGLGHDPDDTDFDLERLEALACTMKNEGLPCSIFAQDGKEVAAILGDLFTDCGWLVGWNVDTGLFSLQPVRKEEDDIPNVSADLIEEVGELVTELGERGTSVAVYQFSDKNNAYKPVTIVVGDDGQSSYLEHQHARRIDVNTVVHFAAAAKVAERRSQEAISRGSQITLVTKHSTRLLYPGRLITVAGLTGVFRILEVALTPISPLVRITAIADFYGQPVVEFKPAESPVQAPPDFTPEEDLQFDIFEVPAHLLTAPEQVLIVPRIRDNTQIQFADLHLSEDDTTYQDEGREFDAQTGGTLDAEWSASTAYEVAQGPVITLLGPDASAAVDLTGDEAGWRSGRQMVLVGDEILFVKKLTALGGSSYRLDGVLRARFDTERATHAAASKVYVVQLGKILELRSALLAPNKEIFAKSQPSGQHGAISLASVTADSRTLIGKGIVPMPVGALRTADQRSTFRTGEDVDFLWSYRSTQVPRTGAGMQGAGIGVGASEFVGDFELKFYTLGLTLKATKLVDATQYTYENIDILADFGGEESFIVEVRNVNGAWKSAARSIQVSLV